MRTAIVGLLVVVAAAWGAFALAVGRARPGSAPAGGAEGSRAATSTAAAGTEATSAAGTGPASGASGPSGGSASATSDADGVKFGSFLGDENRRTYGVGPAPGKLELIWKVKLGSGLTQRKADNKPVTWAGNGWTGQCTVVREGGRDYLLVGAYDHNLHRIDALTGKVVWQSAWDDVIKGTNTVFANPHPTGPDDRIIVVAGSRRGSGYSVGDPRIAPFKAVSFATGKELWRFPIPKTPQYSQDVDSSSLLVGDTLYVPVEPGYVYGLDPNATQEWMRWRRPVVRSQSPPLWTSADVKA
ncbi:MAG TPA: PQQ-binding-like beta-propeller repeat protein, partial [Coriobacteriia bacterium]